jgi:hypothetical protein
MDKSTTAADNVFLSAIIGALALTTDLLPQLVTVWFLSTLEIHVDEVTPKDGANVLSCSVARGFM